MSLERIRYKIYKLLPIIIPVALLIIALVCIFIGQLKGNRDRPEEPPAQITDSNLEQVNPEEVENLQQHLQNNTMLVEVTRTNNWNTSEYYETYYDYISNSFVQYKITVENGIKQYAKLTTTCVYSGKLNEVKVVLDSLPTDCSEVNFTKLDEGLYAVNALTDGYIWVAKQIEDGKTVNTVKITATYIDVYFTDNGTQRRAIITDRYILVDDYIGEVPTY